MWHERGGRKKRNSCREVVDQNHELNRRTTTRYPIPVLRAHYRFEGDAAVPGKVRTREAGSAVVIGVQREKCREGVRREARVGGGLNGAVRSFLTAMLP